MDQVQWYKSAVFVGDTPVPVYPGAAMPNPANFALPPIAGNFGQYNYGDGARSPVMTCEFAVRDVASEVLSSTMFGYALTRSNDAAHDVSAVTGSTYSGVALWDGYDGFTLATPKFDAFTIGASYGSDIRYTARFCGCAPSAIGTTPTYPGWSSANLLRFDAVTFGGGLANKVYDFNFSFSNNCIPKGVLNGTAYPVAWNAQMLTAGLQVTIGAQDTLPADGTAVAFTITGSAGKTVVVTALNPLWGNRDSRGVPAGPVHRTYTATLRPPNSTPQSCPITVVSTSF